MLTSQDAPLKEALFYRLEGEAEENKVHCFLCPWHCHIPVGKAGVCRVRKNLEGVLYSDNYAKVTSVALDPIEKKPLKNYKPGSMILSLGSLGCNFRCGFCQNYEIAHRDAAYRIVTPDDALQLVLDTRSQGNIGIAYTYNEPSMWYEYIMDVAPKVHQAGMDNILVTNGYIEAEPLKEMLAYIDAVNLDIKGFTEGYYQDACKGRLEPVLSSARLYKQACHLEITTLIVPGENDDDHQLTHLFQWIARELGKETPVHLSRYFPRYEYDKPATPAATLYRARELAMQQLENVYLGNI